MHHTGQFPTTRLRRKRQNAQIRALVRETELNVSSLISPIFIKHGSQIKKPILSMPGQFQLSIDQLEDEIKELDSLGIKSVILFGIPEKKDALGSHAYDDHGLIPSAIQVIKKISPQLLIITDVCFCEYTDHGHCGVVKHEEVDNDATLPLLAKQAVSHAKAGADIIAPSGMMDGGVGAIRQALDENGFTNIPILSYAVKYASSFYGPFREAAEGAPKFGDRRSYQMDIGNAHEALHECALDIQEGADMLMVKPAHAYLDIIYRVKESFPHMPLCAYHTSGEFAMLKAASANGWIDEKSAALEVLTAIRRAGASMIITYYAKDVARWLG